MNGATLNPPRAPQAWSWRRIPWIGGCFIAVIVSMAVLDIVRGYSATATETGRELDAQARVIAEQTTRSLQTVDRVLGHIVDEVRRGAVLGKDGDALHAYLKDQAVGLVQIEGIALFDAAGNALAVSHEVGLPVPTPNLADNPMFQDLRADTGNSLRIFNAAEAIVKKGMWVFPMVRRLETSSGEFAGIVAAGGRVEYFQQFYRDARLDEGTKITLMNRNGTLVARHPPVAAALGQRFPLSDTMLEAHNAGQSGASRSVSPVDGVDRFAALALVPVYPLAVIVTRDAAVALAPWRTQAIGTALRTVALSLLAAWLIALLRRQFVRLDKTRASLEISRERFSLAAEGSDVGIWDWHLGNDRIYASARARELFGLGPGPEDLSRDEWFAAVQIHPDDRAERSAAIRAHLAGETPAYAGEYRVREAASGDAAYRWVRVRGLCVRDAAGAPLRMAGSVADVDARRRAEDALRVSEERYALAMTGSTGGHWVWDVVNDSLFVSETVNQLFGLPADTVAGTRGAYFRRVPVHPDDLPRVLQIDADVRSGRLARFDIEYRISLPGSGAQRWILTRAQCFRDADGKVVRVAGVSVDVSERKRTEDALRLSEERFALAVAGSSDGIIDWDVVNDRMYTSQRTMEMLGVDSQVTTRTRAEWLALLQLHPDDRQRHADELRRFLESDTALREGEYRVRRLDGEYRWVRLRNLCVRDAVGRPIRLAGSVSDIDPYKRVEAALRESEERYALAMTGSNEGHWVWDLVKDQAYASARMNQILGLPAHDYQASYAEYYERIPIHPEDRERARQTRERHLSGTDARVDVEYRIVLPGSGEIRWISVRGQCFRDAQGRPVKLAGSIQDISDRKRAEAALRQSEERFALAVAGSDDGIWDVDYTTRLMFSSRRSRQILGLVQEPEVQPMDECFAMLQVHPDDAQRRQAALHAHLSGEAPAYEGEWRVRHPDGGYRWVRVRGVCVRDAAGKPLRMAGSVSDIDARKRAEDALRESEERSALAMAGSNEGHWVWDIPSDGIYASPKLKELFGFPRDVKLTDFTQYFALIPVHPGDRERVRKAREDHIARRSPKLDHEFRLVMPGSGEERWVHTRGQCFRDEQGNPVRLAGSTVDITERKRAEAARRQSEERFALAVAGSDDGVWEFDYTTDQAFGSRRARQILGLPLEPEVQSVAEWFAALHLHPDDEPLRLAAMDAHLSGRVPAYEGEWRALQPDGSYRWVRARGMCVRDAAGKPLRMAGSVSDIDARKRAEEALRQSQERYALAVAGSDDGVWDWDYAAGIAFESARARELQALPPGPELQPISELVDSLRLHPDDAPRRAEGIRAHLAGETPAYECDYRVRHDDGEYRWIHVRALCIRDASGKPVRMAGSVADIDARKRAEEARRQTEEALRRSEERFALAVAGSNDGIIDWDIVNDRIFASNRALSIIGAASDTTLYTTAEWAKLLRIHPDDVERHEEQTRRRTLGRTGLNESEYRVLHPDSVYRWVRVRGSAVPGPDGKAIRWAGSVSDIDAQKRTEQALRRSEERYQLAVAGSNEGLWDWDLASDSLFISERAQQLTFAESGEPQRPRREWIGRTQHHPDDAPIVREALAAHLRGETRHFKVEYRLRHHTGEWHWYRQRGVAVRDAWGRPTRMAGSMEDITERKKSEAERERLEGQLRQAQKLEAIGTLAGGIAHDFNNILAAILGYGEMALKDAPEGSAQRRHIDAAVSAGMRAKSLVERILAFSRSGMGERIPVHVQAVVVEALDVVAASLPAGVTLERRLDAGDAAVLGDPTQVHQVVVNLCANAAQAMKAHGTLTITLARVDLAEPRCATSVLPAGNYVALSVRDTGTGITPQVLERIFDPFFTTKEIGVGTGLGLSLVHGIVTDLGGGIDVASRVGEGSTFTVYLPWQSCVTAPAPLDEVAPPGGNGETILLVDDEESLVRLGEEMIAELGYEPVGFTSSLAALTTFRAEPQRFNAVLSDEAMPEMTGSEMVAEIRKIRPDIPIVMMSGYVTTGLANRARDAGVAEVLSKPLVSRDIARSLASALQR